MMFMFMLDILTGYKYAYNNLIISTQTCIPADKYIIIQVHEYLNMKYRNDQRYTSVEHVNKQLILYIQYRITNNKQ